MKTNIIFFTMFLCIALCSCITEYDATGIEEIEGIIVVEGIITDDESVITLSRSLKLTDAGSFSPIDNANVYIECDDGTKWKAEPFNWMPRNGRYTIKTGKLNTDKKYRLKIEIEETDYSSGTSDWGHTKIYEYCSDYSYPIKTPEIDNIFWTKRAKGEMVNIHVSTHSADNEVLYYRWSYKEDWEINSAYMMLPTYPYYCWGTNNSRDILLGSAEKTVFGQLTDKIIELSPSDRRLSVMYRIAVKQNAISKRAYDYFTNIKKNAENMGSLFAPVPSELRGNITCITDPRRPTIGYIDISSTTQKTTYILGSDVYESPWGCRSQYFEEPPASNLDYISVGDGYYIEKRCVDCTYYGTTQKPEDWPNIH